MRPLLLIVLVGASACASGPQAGTGSSAEPNGWFCYDHYVAKPGADGTSTDGSTPGELGGASAAGSSDSSAVSIVPANPPGSDCFENRKECETHRKILFVHAPACTPKPLAYCIRSKEPANGTEAWSCARSREHCISYRKRLLTAKQEILLDCKPARLE